MHKVISLVSILGFIALTSCAAVSVNHFQGGKSLGTGITKIGFGSQIGRSVDYDSDEDAIDNPATILFDFSVSTVWGQNSTLEQIYLPQCRPRSESNS